MSPRRSADLRVVALRRAFSLSELLVVLAILAVLVGLALPRMDSATFRADANVRLVRTALQQAHRISAARQHDVIVSFDIPGGRIRVAEDRDNSRTVNAGEQVLWRGLTDGARFVVPPAGVNGAVARAVSGSDVAEFDGMPTMTFGRGGLASSSLEVYVQVDGKRADALRSVTLASATGRTAWYRYSSQSWKRAGG